MEAELKKEFPESTVELVKGDGGIFDITMNGSLIYSKQRDDCEHFPAEGEIIRIVREKS